MEIRQHQILIYDRELRVDVLEVPTISYEARGLTDKGEVQRDREEGYRDQRSNPLRTNSLLVLAHERLELVHLMLILRVMTTTEMERR